MLENCIHDMNACPIRTIHSIESFDPYNSISLIERRSKWRVTQFKTSMLIVPDCILLGKFTNGL